MKYTKDNILGLEFSLGTSKYKIREGKNGFGVYSYVSSEKEFSNYCGPHTADLIVSNFNKGYWKPTNDVQINYEIY